jgi:uncharacterized protein (TIGR03435 family)
MIAFAYEVKNPSKQLEGLPEWATAQSFAVAAKPSPDFPLLLESENRRQVRLMMRKMLAERFGLRLHTETREQAIFGLRVGNGGLKIPEVAAPTPPAKEGNVNVALSDQGGRMIAKQGTMAGLSRALALFLKEPVLDQTGLTGYYDFDIRWSAADEAQASTGLGAEGIGLLISTVRSQFGLMLAKTRGPVEYWVIDHIERPAEN